jgi:hypothetical protein
MTAGMDAKALDGGREKMAMQPLKIALAAKSEAVLMALGVVA